MPARLVLHDLPDLSGNQTENLIKSLLEKLFPWDGGVYTLFPADPPVRPCVGCFGCWVATPGKCVIDDRGSALAPLISKHDELIVIGRLLFGGFSPDVKALLDRSIGSILPFFRIVNGETHHEKRCKNPLSLRYIFYGPDISEFEKGIARRLAAANACNFGAETYTSSFCFYPSADAIGVTS
ncbi:MAG: hypothetical protein LBP21_03650 [Synergistaceae bacterium]|nr:hypothetical protein [Synergistaceae bacterium]